VVVLKIRKRNLFRYIYTQIRSTQKVGSWCGTDSGNNRPWGWKL